MWISVLSYALYVCVVHKKNLEVQGSEYLFIYFLLSYQT